MGEREQDNPLEWDEIEPANYTVWQNSFNYETIIENSKSRLNSSLEIKLIDENARWIKTIRDNDVYQLNFDKYSQNIDLNELESKRFEDLSDYQSDLTFEPLLYELPIMEQDSVFKINRNRWHENLAKDIYMEEALNVLNDLKNSYSTNNTAQLKD
jgi:carboxyl-terminal processing protease